MASAKGWWPWTQGSPAFCHCSAFTLPCPLSSYTLVTCIVVLLSYLRLLESEASLSWLEQEDPPQEVALDLSLSYIYKVS